MEKPELKKCARCGKQIECKSHDIESCECSKISITPEELQYINMKFEDCMCNACLVKMKNEYVGQK